ncbi:hypothetical protein [Streptomyces sp. NPDC001153]
MLDAVRLGPGADGAAITAAQIREVVERLVAVAEWKHGDPEIRVALHAGYDTPRIARAPTLITGRAPIPVEPAERHIQGMSPR